MAKIFYTEMGQGYPVIFVHGYGEAKEMWGDFQAHLKSGFRTIALDLPGFGESPLFKKDLSIAEAADALKDWMEEMGISECIMIGHSLGGYVSLAFAKKYPDKIKGLGLFHSTVFADTSEKKENRMKTIEFIKRNGGKVFMENFVPALFYEQNRPRLMEMIQSQVEIGKNTSDEALIAYMDAMANRADSSEFIKGFDKPVLMIIGEKDTSVPFEKSMEQARLLKKPHVHILDLTGHMGMFERERETLFFVESFVKKVAES